MRRGFRKESERVRTTYFNFVYFAKVELQLADEAVGFRHDEIHESIPIT